MLHPAEPTTHLVAVTRGGEDLLSAAAAAAASGAWAGAVELVVDHDPGGPSPGAVTAPDDKHGSCRRRGGRRSRAGENGRSGGMRCSGKRIGGLRWM
jgi:hypothetical protein